MKAKKRQPGTGKPWPDLRKDREWCVVFKDSNHNWHRLYFWAKSREEAEKNTPIAARFKRVENRELWLAADLEERDNEALRIKEAKKPSKKSDPLPIPAMTDSELRCRKAQYQAYKRAYAAGLSLWWIKDDLRSQLEAFKPRPVFGEIYGSDPKESGAKPSMHRLKVKREGRDPSPWWENGVRAMEG